MDDLLIMGNSLFSVLKFKEYLHTCFSMKDLGTLKYFLGIEVTRSSSGCFLCQRKYTLELISETGLLGAKPTSTPIEPNHNLTKSTSSLFHLPDRYRCLVGKLIYLTITGPDLAFIFHSLAQFLQAPTSDHWDAALRIVRYLKVSPGQSILLKADSSLSL